MRDSISHARSTTCRVEPSFLLLLVLHRCHLGDIPKNQPGEKWVSAPFSPGPSFPVPTCLTHTASKHVCPRGAEGCSVLPTHENSLENVSFLPTSLKSDYPDALLYHVCSDLFIPTRFLCAKRFTAF